MGTAAAAGGIGHRGQIPGAVPEQGNAFLGQRGQHQLAHLALGQGVACGRIDNLGQEMVFPQVHAAVLGAVNGNARSHDFGEAVDIMGINAHFLLYGLAHAVRPGLAAENAYLQGKIAGVDTLLYGCLAQMQRKGGRAGKNCGAKIAQELGLAAGGAA